MAKKIRIRDEKGRILSGAHISPKTEFKKGQISLNKGKIKENYKPLKRAGINISKTKNSKEWKETKGLLFSKNIREANKGKHNSLATEFKKGIIPWNKNLTKETDERVRKNAENKMGLKKLCKKNNYSFEDKKKEIVKLYKKGDVSCKGLGKRFNCSKPTISKILKEQGIIPTTTRYPEKKYYESEVRKCECGCGSDVKGWNSRTKKPKLYCVGHNLLLKESREKNIKANKVLRKNKTYEEIYGEEKSKIIKNKMSKAGKGRIMSEIERKKSSAAQQGIPLEKWQKFISREPYDQRWTNKFRRAVRKRDNQVCMNCGLHREKLKQALSIHHINYDKRVSIPQNCISLCRKCHGLTVINRKYWTKLFQEKLTKLYNYQYAENQEIILNLGEIPNA